MKYKIPTGFLLVNEYSRGLLETLSIGDYGKSRNVKADFLGYTRELNGVENGEIQPISEKWVMTLSTQYGCIQKCRFCACPNVPFHGNASLADLWDQIGNARGCFASARYVERLNVHFARMGEPIVNDAVFEFSRAIFAEKGGRFLDEFGLSVEVLHPVLTTSLPRRFKKIEQRLNEWVEIKNKLYNGQAGLQISVNSTDEAQREEMFAGGQMELVQFAKIASKFPRPIGRKYCLNFAYSSQFEIDANKLADLFDVNKWMVKITPIHNNKECKTNGYKTECGYDSYSPYRDIENKLKEFGFDVLVFVPSMDEENGLVTCGNAVLGGSTFAKAFTDLP